MNSSTENLSSPRITFGMIVLNGEPFSRYNLRSIYPWAHQIIVVEGACKAAAAVATPDGHSTDDTLEVLRRFQTKEDPDKKVTIVTAEDEGHPDGFWPGEKDEMSQAYAKRAVGNYLWQVDSDEFYREEDMPKIMQLLTDGPDAISFPTLHFWGSPNYVTDGFNMICNRYREYHRLFRWGPGYTYATHRPPKVLDADGVDLRDKRWLDADDMDRNGVSMYHYSFLFPHQVLHKVCYYATPGTAGNTPGMAGNGYQHGVLPQVGSWEERTYGRLERPFHAHIVQTHISWLHRFRGTSPGQVVRMMEDIAGSRLPVETRDCSDIEALLARPSYQCSVFGLRLVARAMATPFGRRLQYRLSQCHHVIQLLRRRALIRTVLSRWGLIPKRDDGQHVEHHNAP